jgi:hypothetical protein
MTDRALLEKVEQVPDILSDELSHFVDYLIYKSKCQSNTSRQTRLDYDFNSYKVGLSKSVSLTESLESIRNGERF